MINLIPYSYMSFNVTTCRFQLQVICQLMITGLLYFICPYEVGLDMLYIHIMCFMYLILSLCFFSGMFHLAVGLVFICLKVKAEADPATSGGVLCYSSITHLCVRLQYLFSVFHSSSSFSYPVCVRYVNVKQHRNIVKC